MASYKIGVVGAGIIGATTAFVLQKAGHQVTVFDPHPAGVGGASFGNAGHIAASDVLPLSGPGIIFKGLRMWFDEKGGLHLDPLFGMQNARWFWKFLRTARRDNFARAHAALSDLGRSCLDHTEALYKQAKLDHLLSNKGVLFIYDSAKSQQKSNESWELKAKAGFDSEIISTKQLHHDVPGLNSSIGHSTYCPSWQMVVDPHRATCGFANAALALGATVSQESISHVDYGERYVAVNTIDGYSQFEYLVVCAGIETRSFANKLGDYVPIIPERGYNLTFPDAEIDPSISLVFADRGIVATHMKGGLRIGGWAEYAPAYAPPRDKYFTMLAEISSMLFPRLNRAGAKPWMGARPSTPDSVPIISPSLHSTRILYNCGHGHYGLTHAAGSALRVLDLVEQEKKFDHCHCSLKRFLPN